MKHLKSKTDWTWLEKEDDSEIDYSDIPETTKEFWADAELLMPTQKTAISIRLDNKIIEYFKRTGSGYQSKINAVLKAYVKNHSKLAHDHR